MENIKISIVLPFFGVEKYIEECLRSLVSQTLREIEIICIDDQSPDRSRIIVEEFMKQDSRIRLLVNEQNKGVSVSRNRGLEEARGEYVYIMDSDDFLVSADALERIYEQAVQENADLVIADAYTYFDDGRKERYDHPYRNMPTRYWLGQAAWWYIFKRSIVETHPYIRFPEHAHPAEDEVFSFMLFSYAKDFSYFRNPLLYYRQHENMCMNQIQGAKKEKHFKSKIICAEQLVNFFRVTAPEGIRLRRTAYIRQLRYLTDVPKEYHADFSPQLRRELAALRIRKFFVAIKVSFSGKMVVRIFGIPVVCKKIKGGGLQLADGL